MRCPVLLHGFTGSSASWGDAVLDGLASAGLPPVLVDLPGHGRFAGDRDPASFGLSRALADLPDPGGAGLVGYSMGGRIALHYALAHPARVGRLVLESASPGLATEPERAARRAADERLAGRLERSAIDEFVRERELLPLFASQAALPEEIRMRQCALRRTNDPGSLAAALRGLGTGALPSLWGALAELSLPVLLLVGALDPKFVDIAERMAGRLPDARLVVVPDAGHTVHLERPGAWLEAVTAFLR